MSTAVAEPAAPAAQSAPPDMKAMLYGSAPKVPTVLPAEGQPSSVPSAETGPSATAEPSAVPAAEGKSETVKADAQDQAPKPDDGHMKAARRLGKEVQDLKAQLAQQAEELRVFKAKADGTYEEPQGPTPEQVQAKAIFEGRELASRELANQKYGPDKVQARIYDPECELNQFLTEQQQDGQTWQNLRIVQSHQPTMEAWKILEERAFQKTYGTDPTQWKAKILAEARPSMVEEIRAELKKTLAAMPTGAPAPSVTVARGDGGPAPRRQSLADLMYAEPKATVP